MVYLFIYLCHLWFSPSASYILLCFFHSHGQMWELGHKEGWVPKNWCFQTMVLEKTLESSLDSKEIKAINPKGNQPWIFIGRTDAEAETPIPGPPDAKSWRIGRDPDAGKDWGQEEKRMTEDEMVRWHHWLDGHGFGWTPGVDDGQGSLACWGSWGRKESDTTERLNWTEAIDEEKRKEERKTGRLVWLHMLFTAQGAPTE